MPDNYLVFLGPDPNTRRFVVRGVTRVHVTDTGRVFLMRNSSVICVLSQHATALCLNNKLSDEELERLNNV